MSTSKCLFACALALGVLGSLPAAGQGSEKPAPPAAEQAAPAQPTAPPAQAPVAPPKSYYDSLEISITGKAENNGTISMELLPLGGAAKVINVNILAKMSRKDVTRDLGKELTIAAGSAYKVKVKSDSIVIKKASSKNPNLSVSLTGQTVNGVAILIQKN